MSRFPAFLLARRCAFLWVLMALCLPLAAQPGDSAPPSESEATDSILALVGGRLIDGYGGPPIQDAVVVIQGNRIQSVGPRASTPVPMEARVISTEGRTVMPGLMDMHVHLMILGHGDYEHWDKTYTDQFRDLIMPIAAKQLLHAGVTTVRDVGARIEDIFPVKQRIASGEIPGPRVYATGPFLQKRVDSPWEEPFRWTVNGAADARAKTQQILDAGADCIKVIDQDQMSLDELQAIVDTAHTAGKHIVAHAHRTEEIRRGLQAGVDCFEHTGLGTQPGYPEDVLKMITERQSSLYWCPTIEGLFLYPYTVDHNPARLQDPRLKQDLPPDLYEDIRASLEHPQRLEYFQLIRYRVPTLAHKFQQLMKTGVTMVVGTDSGIPMNFHFDSTWRELDAMVRLGMDPMNAIRAATFWPARLLKADADLGTIEPGKLADLIVVDGDPLTSMSELRHIEHVIKDGQLVR
ncbi:MAG TPA: amidohydrolase family protein [Acidobacteriota bacterium]